MKVLSITIQSDDFSRLFIDDFLPVDNDVVHGVQEVTGTIALKTGMRYITDCFFEKGSGQKIEAYNIVPGNGKRSIEVSVLWHSQ